MLFDELAQMTADEWTLTAVATILCVGGLLLPMAGNLLGRAFLGEDPAVRSWRRKWAERRAMRRTLREERRADKRRRKAARKARKLGGKRSAATEPGGSA